MGFDPHKPYLFGFRHISSKATSDGPPTPTPALAGPFLGHFAGARGESNGETDRSFSPRAEIEVPKKSSKNQDSSKKIMQHFARIGDLVSRDDRLQRFCLSSDRSGPTTNAFGGLTNGHKGCNLAERNRQMEKPRLGGYNR